MRAASTTKQTFRLAAAMALTTIITTAGCAAQKQVVLRDDVAITQDVRDRIGADPVAKGAKIAVDTKAGIVQLTGSVNSDTIRDSAEKIARDTPGVRSVDNDVRFGN